MMQLPWGKKLFSYIAATCAFSFFGSFSTHILAGSAPAAKSSMCSNRPEGTLFAGLKGSSWHVYFVAEEGQPPQPLPISEEARSPVWSARRNAVLYVNESGDIRSFSIDTGQTVTLRKAPARMAFTQLDYDAVRDLLYAVQLKEGKSSDTDIQVMDLGKSTSRAVVPMRSAQFEPYAAGSWLYFGNMHCVVGCNGQIIEELWRYHTVTGKAEQLTLTGHIARQPVVSVDRKWLYFSSNIKGFYHIYRQPIQDTLHTEVNRRAAVEPVTQGMVTDMSPAPCRNRLYFIRHDGSGTHLMCVAVGQAAIRMSLPDGIIGLRDLEIKP